MKSPFSDNRTKSREVEVHTRVVAQKSCGINLLFLIITDVHFPSVCIFKASRRRKENKETTVKSHTQDFLSLLKFILSEKTVECNPQIQFSSVQLLSRV